MRCFLGPESVRADNALALAAEAGRFDELRRELFAAQPPEHTGGFTTEDPLDFGRRARMASPHYAAGVREGRYEAWAQEIDEAFQEQDPQGTPAARLTASRSTPECSTTVKRWVRCCAADGAPWPHGIGGSRRPPGRLYGYPRRRSLSSSRRCGRSGAGGAAAGRTVRAGEQVQPLGGRAPDCRRWLRVVPEHASRRDRCGRARRARGDRAGGGGPAQARAGEGGAAPRAGAGAPVAGGGGAAAGRPHHGGGASAGGRGAPGAAPGRAPAAGGEQRRGEAAQPYGQAEKIDPDAVRGTTAAEVGSGHQCGVDPTA
jgi:hypothetical protein